jgi:hypothetical protein
MSTSGGHLEPVGKGFIPEPTVGPSTLSGVGSVNGTIRQIAESVGFDVGERGARVQAELINGLAHGFATSMPEGEERDTQIAYIDANVTHETHTFLNDLIQHRKGKK